MFEPKSGTWLMDNPRLSSIGWNILIPFLIYCIMSMSSPDTTTARDVSTMDIETWSFSGGLTGNGCCSLGPYLRKFPWRQTFLLFVRMTALARDANSWHLSVDTTYNLGGLLYEGGVVSSLTAALGIATRVDFWLSGLCSPVRYAPCPPTPPPMHAGDRDWQRLYPSEPGPAVPNQPRGLAGTLGSKEHSAFIVALLLVNESVLYE